MPHVHAICFPLCYLCAYLALSSVCQLQQVFIEKTIKSEQEEYLREGISWTPVQYFNNKIVCDLIESKKPAGIIAFLDEECLLGKGSDLTFLDKLEHNLKSHAHFERTKGVGKPADSFVIKHYAGDVSYNCANFLDKNKGQFSSVTSQPAAVRFCSSKANCARSHIGCYSRVSAVCVAAGQIWSGVTSY